MFRPTFAAFSACCFFSCFAAAEEGPLPPVTPRPISMVAFARQPGAIVQFEENNAVVRRMVDQAVMTVTGQASVAGAWRSLVTPRDRVGIKVATGGAPYASSHRGIVDAVVSGLEQAGVPRSQIIVWDRDVESLRMAGFTGRAGYGVRAIDPPNGYDREAAFTAPVLGKLIWGDLLFREKVQRIGGRRPSEADQLSSTSHLASVLSREVTKVINVPVLMEEASCGIAGALYNMTVPNVDNWRRFLQLDASNTESIATLYADPRIAPKVVLHIMDALVVQYAGGPGFQPNYAFEHGTIYVSRDPVALDALAVQKLNEWRQNSRLSPVGKRADWLDSAAQLGLGNVALDRIDMIPAFPGK